jgi:uncharacterized protein (TIGR03382 family)
MQFRRTFVLFGLISASTLGFSGLRGLAAAPGFTVSAANATMPSTGIGSIPITLTSIDGFTGSITASCNPASPPAGAKLPVCGGPTAPPIYTLTANGTVNGTITLMPYSDRFLPVAASVSHHPGPVPETGFALAGALLFGWLVRRRRFCRLMMISFAICTLGSATAITACGGSSNGMTPGTYAYTVTAGEINGTAYVTTTVNVTVP